MVCATSTVLQLEKLVLRFQTHAYHRALVIVHQRRSAIAALAEDLVTRPDATVSAARLNEMLAEEPDKVDDSVMDSLPFKELIPETASSLCITAFFCVICSYWQTPFVFTSLLPVSRQLVTL